MQTTRFTCSLVLVALAVATCSHGAYLLQEKCEPMTEIMPCLTELQANLTTAQGMTNLSEELLDSLCSGLQEATKCIKGVISRCIGPDKLASLMQTLEGTADSPLKRAEKFCVKDEARTKLMGHAKCFNEKVFNNESFDTKCPSGFLKPENIDIGKIATGRAFDFCCQYNKWQPCFKNESIAACGAEGFAAFEEVFDQTRNMKSACPARLYTASRCAIFE